MKAAKELVAKVAPPGDLLSEAFLTGLLEFRNMPHESGLSPAQIVFGHQLCSIIPAHRSSYASQWKEAIAARESKAAADGAVQFRYVARTRPLPPLSIGASVRVQDPDTKLSDRVGVIVAIGRYRTYHIKFASGAFLRRNRRFLRLLIPATSTESVESIHRDGEAGDAAGDSDFATTDQLSVPPLSMATTRRSTSMRHSRVIV